MKKLSMCSWALVAMMGFASLTMTGCDPEEGGGTNPGAKLETDSEVMGAQLATANSFYTAVEKKTLAAGDVSANGCAKVNDVIITFAQTGTPAFPRLMSYPERRNQSLTTTCATGGVSTTFALTDVTPAQFSNIEADGNVDYKRGIAATGGAAFVNVEAKKVYSFSSGARKGLILVDSYTPGASVGLGTIEAKFIFTK